MLLKRSGIAVAVIFLLIYNFSSCIKDKGELVNNSCDTTYFARVINPIIQTKCAVEGCHVSGGNGAGDYTQFSDILARVRYIEQRIHLPVTDPFHMPNGDTLSANRITLLTDWIDQGAKGCD